MTRPSIVILCLLASLPGRYAAASAKSDQADNIGQPSLEMLEFLGEWDRDRFWFDHALEETTPEQSVTGDIEVKKDEE